MMRPKGASGVPELAQRKNQRNEVAQREISGSILSAYKQTALFIKT